MKLIKGFGYAFRGIFLCIREERNFRIHLVAIITVLLFASLYGLSRDQYPALILILALVPALEAHNTAMERAVDLEAKTPEPLARDAKDAASAAVLIAAIGAVCMACVLFSDTGKLLSVLRLFAAPMPCLALAAYIAVSAIFVFLPERYQKS